jgi:hypothetical protein
MGLFRLYTTILPHPTTGVISAMTLQNVEVLKSPGHLDITKGKDIPQGQKLTGAQSPMAPGFWSGLLNFYL